MSGVDTGVLTLDTLSMSVYWCKKISYSILALPKYFWRIIQKTSKGTQDLLHHPIPNISQ